MNTGLKALPLENSSVRSKKMDSSIQDVKAASEFIGILMGDALLSIMLLDIIFFPFDKAKYFAIFCRGKSFSFDKSLLMGDPNCPSFYLIENDPVFKTRIEEAYTEYLVKGGVSADAIMKKLEKRRGTKKV